MQGKTGKRSLLASFAVLAILIPVQGRTGEPFTLQLADAPGAFANAGFYMAEARGHYQSRGLNVRFLPPAPPTQKDPVLAGEAQAGLSNSQLVVRRIQGEPLVVLAAFLQHSATALALRQQAPTDNIHDLTDRRALIAAHHTELLAGLAREGAQPRWLTRTTTSPGIGPLLRGEAEAVSVSVTTAPFDLQQARVPYLLYTPRSSGLDTYDQVLYTSEAQLDRGSAPFQQFLEASLEGWREALEQPEAAIALIQHQYDPSANPRRLAYEARQIAALMQADKVPIGTMLAGRWTQIAEAYADLGLVPHGVDLQAFLYQQETPTSPWVPVSLSLLMALVFAGVASYVHYTNRELRTQIKEIVSLEQSLKDDALRDPLTGLFNRRYLHETLPHEFSRAQRHGYALSVAMVDIDYFKDVNDHWGHLAGDEILKTLAQLLNDTLRSGDLASRWGGEEFLLVMPNTPKEVARQRAEAWCRQFAELRVPYGTLVLNATLSAGIASFPEDGSEVNDIIQAADLALYLAKSGGRNQVVPFPSSE